MVFLEKILIYIKKIFNKKDLNNINENSNKSISKEEIVKDNVANKDDLIENVKDIDEELLKELKNVKLGTIVVSNRYFNEVEKNNIEEGHRNGPFIVYENTGSKLFCCYGTGTIPPNDVNESVYMKFNKSEYTLSKNTYFSLLHIFEIDYSDVIKIVNELNEKDKNILLKKINILKIHKRFKKYVPKVPRVRADVGDIISENFNPYLIIDIKDDNYICIPLIYYHKSDNSNVIKLDGSYYLLNFNSITKIKKDSKTFIINTLNNDKLLSILKKYKEYNNNKENKNHIQRGSVLRKDDKYFYVYGENGNKWLIFSISKVPLSDSNQFRINNKYYHSKFNEFFEIEKNNYEYEIVDLALNKEMDEINIIRKKIKIDKKREVKNQDKIKVYKDFVPGDVIKTKTLSDDEYIVIKRDDKIVYCIAFDEWNKDKPRLYRFEINFIRKSYYNKLKDSEQVIEEKIYKLTKEKN